MTARKFEIAIIGAGPAGASAAIRLARAGRSVALIDRFQFPREKVCGGCLSGPGTAYLKELLSESAIPGLPASRISFIVRNRRIACAPHGASIVLNRTELDARLVQAACDAGAMPLLGAPASLDRIDERWMVRIADQPLQTDHILLAGGLGGLVRKLGIPSDYRGPTLAAQQWTQPWQPGLPQPGEVEMHWLRGGYIGLGTPDPNLVVVGLAAFMRGIEGRSAFEHLRIENPDAAIFGVLPPDAPVRFGARGAAGFPWLPTRVVDRNLLLLGDAAGYAEPFTGEGMGLAFLSADCAATAILGSRDPAGEYAHQMRMRHTPILRRTRRVAWLLRTSGVGVLSGLAPFLPQRWLSRAVARMHVEPIKHATETRGVFT